MSTPKWEGVVLHHTASPDRPTLDWNGIRRYHTEGRGWRDIGYHFGVEKHPSGYVALIGRPLNQRGAHEPKANRTHIGIALVGNFSRRRIEPKRLTFLAKYLIAPLLDLIDVPADRDGSITFHRDWKATECPGKLFDEEAQKFLLRAVSKFQGGR